MWGEVWAFPIPPHRARAAHSRWQLDLHTLVAGQVDRIVDVLTAQICGNRVEVARISWKYVPLSPAGSSPIRFTSAAM